MKKSLSEKVSLYRGDITLLEVDAIVNAGEWFTFLYFLCYVFMISSIFYTVWVQKCFKSFSL